VNVRTGQWRFNPAQRDYMPLSGNQSAQNYDAYVVGDPLGQVWNMGFPSQPPCMASAPERSSTEQQQGRRTERPARAAVEAVRLPSQSLNKSAGSVTVPVKVTKIDPAVHGNLQAFQGDFTYDARAISFQSAAVNAGAVMNNNGGQWVISANANLTNTSGAIRTCRVTAFCLNNIGLSTNGAGSGTLFNLNVVVGGGAKGANSALDWAAGLNQFRFFDTDGFDRPPAGAPRGQITLDGRQGKR
jgi:hypothetical protein